MRRLALWLLFAPMAAGATPMTQMHYVMGTYLRITADGAGAGGAMRRCFDDARRLDATFSRWDGWSELTRVNASGGARREVSPEFATLLRRSLALSSATDGGFDVTVGPVMRVLRAGGSIAALEEARRHVGIARVALHGNTLVLEPGAELDFDGVAKGWTVDRCIRLLRDAGVTRALVSFGESSAAAIGAPRGASAWNLTVRGPGNRDAVGTLHLRDRAVSISAAFGGPGGRRAAHIVDPRRGAAVVDDAVAVVVAASATDAEAWSKVVLIRGFAGVAAAEHHGLGAVHVTSHELRAGPRAARTFTAFHARRPIQASEEGPW